MKGWIRRLRGAAGTGITWAVAWGVTGVGIGAASLLPWHPFGPFLRVFDAPLPAMFIPGFVGGVFFSSVLSLLGRRRAVEEYSLAAFAALGALGGVLLTLFPLALVAVGMASTEGSPHSTTTALAAIGPVFVVLGALSAAASLLVARRAVVRDGDVLPDDDPAPPALTEGMGRGGAASFGKRGAEARVSRRDVTS